MRAPVAAVALALTLASPASATETKVPARVVIETAKVRWRIAIEADRAVSFAHAPN